MTFTLTPTPTETPLPPPTAAPPVVVELPPVTEQLAGATESALTIEQPTVEALAPEAVTEVTVASDGALALAADTAKVEPAVEAPVDRALDADHAANAAAASAELGAAPSVPFEIVGAPQAAPLAGGSSASMAAPAAVEQPTQAVPLLSEPPAPQLAAQPAVVPPAVAAPTLPPETVPSDAAAAPVNSLAAEASAASARSDVTAAEVAAPAAPESALAAPTSAQLVGVVPLSADSNALGFSIILTLPDGSRVSAVPDASGAFAFEGLLPGDYVVEAISGPPLLKLRAVLTLAEGQRAELPPPTLYTGDTNGDNVVDVRDAALVAANFNGPALVSYADLNNDSWVDIRDLALVGVHFGLRGPLPWR